MKEEKWRENARGFDAANKDQEKSFTSLDVQTSSLLLFFPSPSRLLVLGCHVGLHGALLMTAIVRLPMGMGQGCRRTRNEIQFLFFLLPKKLRLWNRQRRNDIFPFNESQINSQIYWALCAFVLYRVSVNRLNRCTANTKESSTSSSSWAMSTTFATLHSKHSVWRFAGMEGHDDVCKIYNLREKLTNVNVILVERCTYVTSASVSVSHPE